jgi:hypothetical protein
MRAIGYTLETALADVVDNSIAAGAKRIAVDFFWDGPRSRIVVTDDGRGMTDGALREALRPGTQGPLAPRSAQDLGRFGLGLKTASFSQGRRLTVLSKPPGGPVSYWLWDLDHVVRTNRWELVRQPRPDAALLAALESAPSGTVVVWDALDRLTGHTAPDNPRHRDAFLAQAQAVKQHLSMVFHRFLETGRIRLEMNGHALEPWDPFLRGVPATKPHPDEPLDGGVFAKGYVLPHHSLLTAERHRLAGGAEGWNTRQGFYLYRNERLLVAGDWLGMFKKEEHYKLARIRVDIPSTADADWHLDIKKCSARPPASLRGDLERIAKYVRREAEEVYRTRAKATQRSLPQEFTMVWQQKQRLGKRHYEINRGHPLVVKALTNPEPTALRHLLRLLEETVPVPLISLNESSQPDGHGNPFEGVTDELLALLKLTYEGMKPAHGPAGAKRILLMTEPFNDYPHLVESL